MQSKKPEPKPHHNKHLVIPVFFNEPPDLTGWCESVPVGGRIQAVKSVVFSDGTAKRFYKIKPITTAQKLVKKKSQEMTNKREFRSQVAEIRAKSDGSKVIAGYCAMFNSPSQDLGSFIEVIKPGAFSKCLAGSPDVRCLFNHNQDVVLGRTSAGTLRLTEDAIGLKFECDLPDTQAANDLHTSIKRGDVNQCSFGFFCRADNWLPTTEAPGMLREILEADVFDCSPVTFPAYQATSLSARSLFPDGQPDAVQVHGEDANRRQAAASVLAAIALEDAGEDLDLQRLRDRRTNLY